MDNTAAPEPMIGLSGWNYPKWRGKFYPKGLPQKDELAYVCQQFPTLELNSPFYRLQRTSTYEKWAAAAPDSFVFAVKGWRAVSHFKKMREAEKPLASFLGSVLPGLGPKLGPILWQLPPSLSFNAEVLADFLTLLPTTFAGAQKLLLENPPGEGEAIVLPEELGSLPLTYALEPRHKSFASPEALDLLREHGVALVEADSAGRHPEFNEVTADFVYARLHGSPRIYYSNYSEQFLEGWAERITVWRNEGTQSYIYFDNTALGHAPNNALRLLQMVE